MPEIRPLRALRYDASRVGDLSLTLCSPYDVLSSDDQARLRAQSPYNFVRLILPRDESGIDRYRAARDLLESWRRDGTLKRDPTPAYYFYEQEYSTGGGETLCRRGIFALVRLHDFSERVILPHEQTMPAPREDRYRLLEASAAHLDPVFALYTDPDQTVDTLFTRAAQDTPLVEARAPDGVQHRLWLTDRKEEHARITAALANTWVVIADGHHRYESALRYSRSQPRDNGSPKPCDFMLMVLCNIDAPGLSVLPIHRMIHSVPEFDAQGWLRRLEEWFESRPLDLAQDNERAAQTIEGALQPFQEQGGAVVIATGRERDAQLLTLRPGVDRAQELGSSTAGPLLRLDVSLVHGLILERSLKMTSDEQLHQTRMRYAKSTGAALDDLGSGSSQAAIFMNPTPIRSIVDATSAGLRMPPKSTFFYPKMISGLVIHPFDDEG